MSMNTAQLAYLHASLYDINNVVFVGYLLDTHLLQRYTIVVQLLDRRPYEGALFSACSLSGRAWCSLEKRIDTCYDDPGKG
ncbi:hypothetical protein Pmar_PMAR019395, partial [Perkinsus marinus ATCC 50983]